jgi:hypothetical protein
MYDSFIMFNRKTESLAIIILALIILASCQKIAYKDKTQIEDDPIDYVWDTSTVVQVTLNGTSITVDPAVATIIGSKLTITEAGTYNITGSLTNGQIVVNSQEESSVRLILNGVNITCSNNAPLYIKDSKKTIINLAAGTDNYLTDGTTYSTTDEPKAALFSNSDLIIFGSGSLTVTGKYNDGISTDDGLLIKSGTISVTAADDGIRGKDCVIIKSGKITVVSKGDGIKSSNTENTSLGYITIDSALVYITTTTGDGISAKTSLSIADGSFSITAGGGAGTISTGGGGPGGGGSSGYSGTISEKGLKGGVSVVITKGTFNINSADDAIHSNGSVTINGGTFNLSTGDDGIHAPSAITINGGSVNITKCYEGIESSLITVNSGDVSVASVDDAFNTTKGSATESNDGSWLYIKGGNITVNASTGDGLDSNGNVAMTAGTVIVQGPQSSPEVGFDVNGTFNVSGGLLIGSGPNSGNMIEGISTTSTQYGVKATITSNLAASTLFHIQDASGNELITFKPVRNCYYIVYSSPVLLSGSKYYIYTGGSSTGTLTNGIYVGGTYSGGTSKANFTVSSKVTNVSL